MSMGLIFETAKKMAVWAWGHKRAAAEIILVILFVISGWSYNRKTAELDKIKTESGQLADGLKTQIGMVNGQLEILRRQKNKVVIERIYVPAEGGITIKDPVKPGSDVVVTVKDKGFTFKPGFGVSYAGMGLTPRLDIKWFYFKRYSALFGGGKEGLDISVSRHLDDIIWGHPQNIEAFAGWQFLRRAEASPVTAGLRANF